MAYVEMAGRVLLACVFLVSAGGKLRGRAAFAAFRDSLPALRLLPTALVAPAAVLTVLAESAVPLLLALPALSATPAAALLGPAAALGLVAVLTGVVLTVVRHGATAHCLCFGASPVRYGKRHAVRNAVLASAAALTLLGARAGGTPEPAATALCAAAGLLAAAVLITLDDLVDLFAPPAARTRERVPG
ncbi:MauE/DoxX family redox-associated membrane protein [Streptomyces sp. NPDC060194]|uniref:MauE/DoxX family redox-associated membrane protein n=1 Tax=Streptomyces sp. NPDC060194 TaxID=3347069 RepID=UPI0036634574